MKKGFLLCFCLGMMTLTGYNLGAQNIWMAIDSFAGPGRSGAVSFALKNSAMHTIGYVGAGGDNGQALHYKDMWQYDPSTRAWSQIADFPDTAKGSATVLVLSNKAYVACGVTGNGSPGDIFASVWMYDGTTNNWSAKNSFAGGARWAASGFSINGKGYIVGGNMGSGGSPIYLNDVWQYDPVNDSWTQKTDFPGSARQAAISFAIDTSGDGIEDIAYLGSGTTNDSSTTRDFWQYNPVTDSWTRKADIPNSPRCFGRGFSIKQKAFIGFGATSAGTSLNDLHQYNLSTNTWTAMDTLPSDGRNDCAVFIIGDTAYVGTGAGSQTSAMKDFYRFGQAPTTGINALADIDIDVYPNPVHDKVSLRVNTTLNERATISLIDAAGKSVWSQELSNVAIGTNITVPVTLATGLYVFSINSGTYHWCRKVVVN